MSSIFHHSHDFVSVILIFSSILFYFVVSNFYNYEDVFVNTKYGSVKGFTTKSRDGKTYSVFKSIPYAKPPLGQLRFEPPQELENWEGTRDVSSAPYACTQFDFIWKKVLGSEDCLYLAISTKVTNEKEKSQKLLPVLVFIHGGHFMFGDIEMYDGSYFMDEDIVLVTIQYRLGALGFLNTGDHTVPGNMGLKDQNAALKWVQENIEAFGGDRNRVTLGGESAGAASVHHHLMSEMSKGLMNRAILQSGSSLCPWAYTREPKKQAKRLGNMFNCPTGNSHELVSCLKSIDALEIAETHRAMTNAFVDPQDIYGPSIELSSQENKGNTFLSESPYKRAAEGNYANKVPMIIGLNADEGCFRSAYIIHNQTALNQLSSEWNSISKPAFLLFESGNTETSEKIWTHHFGSSEKKNLSESNYKQLTEVYSDRYFTKCTRDAAILHAQTKSPTYMYYFNLKHNVSIGHALASCSGDYPVLFEISLLYAKLQFYKLMGWKTFEYGVCHGDDIPLMFYPLVFVKIDTNSPHYEKSKQVVKLWTSFATNGSPMPVKDVEWKPINPEKSNLKHLSLGEKVQLIDDPFESRMSFWRTLKLPRNLEPNLESLYKDL